MFQESYPDRYIFLGSLLMLIFNLLTMFDMYVTRVAESDCVPRNVGFGTIVPPLVLANN